MTPPELEVLDEHLRTQPAPTVGIDRRLSARLCLFCRAFPDLPCPEHRPA